MSVRAYFIGGPYDNEWKALTGDFPVIRVAKPSENVLSGPHFPDAEMVALVKGSYQKWLDIGYGVWYYKWQGWDDGELPEMQEDRT